MTRPALSATRATVVFDLLAAYPERAFTMTEIIKATGINIGSCHALINALASRGYLARQDGGKCYTLGPALAAIGQSALKANPLVAAAQRAAERLCEEVGLGALLTTITGGEIMALAGFAGPNGRVPGLRPGQRFPLAAPAGAHIVAWSSAEEVENWVAQAGESTPDEIECWHHAISLIRDRGYQVTLRGKVTGGLGELMTEMANGAPIPAFAAKASELLHSHGWHLDQPEQIALEEVYDVALIAAPIFDQQGKPALSLGLGGFTEKLTGRETIGLAEVLMRTCLEVMHEHRRGAG